MISGFICAFLAYSLYGVLWEDAFYHLTALAFMFYTLTIYLQSVVKNSLVAFIIFAAALNNVIDEFFFDPQIIAVNEYIGFVIIIFITIIFRKTWLRR